MGLLLGQTSLAGIRSIATTEIGRDFVARLRLSITHQLGRLVRHGGGVLATNLPVIQNRNRMPSVGNRGTDWSRFSTILGRSEVGSC